MMPACGALERLRQGNRRFTVGMRNIEALASQRQCEEFVAGRTPFAVILGYADSRVPVETIFDQGLGDLFVL